jgi:photosystem II stability/assembly factor-like uncharacterized protein
MKATTLRVLLFILLVNSVFFQPGKVIAGPPVGGWEDMHNPSVPGGQVNFLVRAPSNPDILYADLKFPYTSYENQILYRSQDGGQTWQDTHNNKLALTSLAVDAENPNILYGTEYDQLIRSLDGGSSWWPFYSFGFEVAAPSQGRIYVLGRATSSRCLSGDSYEFARSLDSGLTWLQIPVACSGQNPSRMFVNPNNPDQIFLSGNGYGTITYTSLDGGLTWRLLEINSIPFGIVDIVFDPAHPGRLFLATRDSALWTSEDEGNTWSACGQRSETATYPYLLQFSQGNLYVIDQAWDSSDHRWHIYRSQDQCASWWKSLDGLPSSAKVFLVNPDSPEKLVAATQGYGVFRSDNGGSTWQESNTGLISPSVVNQLALAPGNPSVILAGGSWPRPALYRSTDGGLNWSSQILEADVISLLIDPSDPLKAWMATSTGILFSSNGVTWRKTYTGPQFILDLALSTQDSIHPYAAGGDGRQGIVLHWGSCALDCSYSYWIEHPIGGSSLIRQIAVNPRDGQDILAGGDSISTSSSNSVIYRSTDGGQSWHEVLRKNYMNQVRDIAIDPTNPSVRYVLLNQMGVYRSQDSGETWEGWPGSLLQIGTGNKLELDDFGGVYLFTNYGIFHRGVLDADWTLLPPPFPTSFTTGAFWRGSSPFLIAAGWSGLYRLNLPTIHKQWLPFLEK